MKKITTVISFLVVALLMSSCNKDQSLQSYLVESQDKRGFMTVDIPLSFIKLKSTDVSEDIQKTFESIKKVNLVALPYQNNEEAYEVEKKAITKILRNSDTYKSLMRMDVKGMKMNIYYTGSSDAIDEVIAFGYSKEAGVGVARILGENMNLSKIMEMMQNIEMDPSQLNLKQFNLSFE
ncbi:MAG: DUF4252 domain-containing protein [Flavobacteriaceae bacterium]|jgi:hypothetical protein